MRVLVRLNETDLAIRKLALLLSYVLLFAIVASSMKAEEVRNFTRFMLVLSCITAIGALIEYRTGYNAFFQWSSHLLPVVTPQELGAVDSIGRKSVVGPTIHPLAVAMMMSLTLPFAFTGFLNSTRAPPQGPLGARHGAHDRRRVRHPAQDERGRAGLRDASS